MPENRASRGMPFVIVWQWLTVAAVVGAAAYVWLEVRELDKEARGIRDGDAEESPGAAALENLHTLEAIARTGPDAVPQLLDSLANPDFRLRRNALLALRLMGPEGAEALAPIRERLADEDAPVRSYAIDAYWKIRRDPDDVAAVVAPMLGDPDAHVREAAAKVLETIGPPSVVVAPMLGDPDANVQEAASKVLESVGPPVVGPVVEQLRSGVPAARVPALKVLWRVGWDVSQPQIDDAVRDFGRVADADMHIAALATLATWGRPTPSEIRELLEHKQVDGARRNELTGPGPRDAALHAIIRLGPDGAENLNDVVELLEEDGRGGHLWGLALAALRSMQSAARPAAPRLLQIVNEIHDSRRRIDIGWTLVAIGADPQEIVAIVAPFLLDKDTDTRFHAGRLCAIASPDEARRQVSLLIPQLVPDTNAVGLPDLNAVWGLAPAAQEAIPALARLLESDQRYLARNAAKALGDIGPEAVPAIPALLAQLARGPMAHDYWARSAFCEAIGKMGPAARSAIPALLAELNDAPLSRPPGNDPNRTGQRPVREVLSALVRIGDSDSAVLAAMRRHLANEDEWVQIAAVQGLARLIPDSPEVLTSYLKWLRDNRGSHNRVGVILAIGRLTGDRQDAVPLLSHLLADDPPEVRKAAAWSLGKIGPRASAALPSLNEALNDWKNSLHSIDNGRNPVQPSIADGPRDRDRLEIGRWHDLDDPLGTRMNELPPHGKSVQHVVRDTIAEIEAGSTESGPPPVPCGNPDR